MTPLRRRLVLAGSLALGVGAGWLAVGRPGGGPATVDTLRLGAYDGDVGALEWIAKDQGYFDRVGLSVDIQGFASGNAAMAAMRAGKVDVATAADLVVAKRAFTEPDLRILADICRYWNKGMLARRDRGIAAPADLRGARIAVPATSSAEHNLMVFLALYGMTTDDVTIVDLQPEPLTEALIAGTVDAAMVWQPHVAALRERLGDQAVVLMDGGTEAHLLLTAPQATLTANPRAVEKLLQGLVMAEEWARRRPQDAKAFVANRFALAPAYVDLIWPRMQLAVGLPQEILEAMDGEARWLARANNWTNRPNFIDTIHSASLTAVRPASVGVFTR